MTKELKHILDSLHECYLLIEHNTKGIVVDEKDTARIYLQKYGYICKPSPKVRVRPKQSARSRMPALLKTNRKSAV